MPAYSDSPFARPPILLVAGKPTYVLGSFNDNTGPTKAIVTATALTTDVATVTLQITAGDIPADGDLISIEGTANGGGAFNVTNAVITAVSIALATGEGTVTFALTHADVPSASDNGIVLIPRIEIGEPLNNVTSIPVTMSFNDPNTTGARTVTVAVTNSANTLSGTPVWNVQGALKNEDDQYVNLLTTAIAIGTSASTSMAELLLNQARFYRVVVSGASGGPSGTVVAKIEV